MNGSEKENKKPKWTLKRIMAIIAILLLVSMYAITLIMAVIDKSSGQQWLMVSLFATVAVPSLLWIYIWIYGKMTGKHTIASFPQDDNKNTDDSE